MGYLETLILLGQENAHNRFMHFISVFFVMPFKDCLVFQVFSALFYAIASAVRFALCGVGGILLVSGLVFLTCTEQDDARHNFGHSGGMPYHHVPCV